MAENLSVPGAARAHLEQSQCASWCANRAGHVDACFSDADLIERSLEPRYRFKDLTESPPLIGTLPDEIEVLVVRAPGAEPHVQVLNRGTRHGLYTLEEAEQYARTLLAKVAIAREG